MRWPRPLAFPKVPGPDVAYWHASKGRQMHGGTTGELLIEVRPKPTGTPDGGLWGPRVTDRADTAAIESFEARAPEIGAALQTHSSEKHTML